MRLPSHPLASGIISIAFVVVVQIFAAPRPVFRFLLPAFLLYLAVVSLYNHFYLKQQGQHTWWLVIRPTLFIVAWFGVFFIIPSEFWRGVFLLAGVPIMYLFERMLGHQGEQLLFNQTLLTAFSGLMTITALSHYYNLPSTLYLFLTFVFMLLLIRASFESVPQSKQVKWISAVCLALALTEVFWATSFLPLHYSALALVGFNVFYCVWTLAYYYLYNHLTAKKIQFHVILAVVFTVVVAVVTPWRIIQ